MVKLIVSCTISGLATPILVVVKGLSPLELKILKFDVITFKDIYILRIKCL